MTTADESTARSVTRGSKGVGQLLTVGFVIATIVTIVAGENPFRTPPPPPAPKAKTWHLPESTEAFDVGTASVEGTRDAPVGIIEFSDFQCPYCAAFVRNVLPTLRDRYTSKAKLFISFRQFPLEAGHKFAAAAAASSVCAASQDRFWPMHDVLFANQKDLPTQPLVTFAEKAGLNLTLFQECMSAGRPAVLDKDLELGNKLKVEGTPSFVFVTRASDGRYFPVDTLVGAQPLQQFEAMIARLTGGAI